MEKNNETLEKALASLSGLEERLSFIAKAEEEFQAKSEKLSGRIDDLFALEHDLEERLDALNTLVTDLNNAIHRYDELKENIEATMHRLEKIDLQGLQESLGEATDAMDKTEKALLSAEKRVKESNDKLRRGKK